MVKIDPSAMANYVQKSPDAATAPAPQPTSKKPIFDGEPTAEEPSDIGTPSEPQPITQYGKTKLPEGSMLIKEVILYGQIYFAGDVRSMKQKTAAIIQLPNGVKVTIEKHPESGKSGSIEIKEDGTVVFNNVSFTKLTGTDGNDNFKFNGDPSRDYGYTRMINTGSGNDTLTNPGAWYQSTIVNSDENLTVKGETHFTNFYVTGNLNTTGVTAGLLEAQASEPKKPEPKKPE